jgi:uncharacterized protein (TIGR02246 family)
VPRPPSPPTAPDEVEAQFYEALQQADLDKLMALWSDDDDVACVHPGGPRVIGHAAIRASFEAIFANGPIPVQPQAVRRVQGVGHAVHHVDEQVAVRTPEGLQQAWVLATNVFVKTAQGWRLVLHHASPAGDAVRTAAAEAPSILH